MPEKDLPETLHIYQWFGDTHRLGPCKSKRTSYCRKNWGLVCPGEIDGKCPFLKNEKNSDLPDLKRVEEPTKGRMDSVIDEV